MKNYTAILHNNLCYIVGVFDTDSSKSAREYVNQNFSDPETIQITMQHKDDDYGESWLEEEAGQMEVE